MLRPSAAHVGVGSPASTVAGRASTPARLKGSEPIAAAAAKASLAGAVSTSVTASASVPAATAPLGSLKPPTCR